MLLLCCKRLRDSSMPYACSHRLRHLKMTYDTCCIHACMRPEHDALRQIRVRVIAPWCIPNSVGMIPIPC